MPLAPEQLLQHAVEAGTLDEQKGRAALAVYTKLQEMGAEFGFDDFLVERGLLTRMAVDAFNADCGESYSAVDTLGDFELVELLGEGEYGAVFKALQKTLGRDVAVKVLNTEIAQDEAAVERFLREARAVAKLNHPNVVGGYSAGSDQGLHYFAMELLEGGSARDAMAENGSLSERRALEIVREAALGLQGAHAAGILHRDVKPGNILLTHDGVAKLTDLGIAQTVHATADGGTFWGSPPYVAPEIVRGTAANDARSDIYSLGATLYELLARRAAVPGRHARRNPAQAFGRTAAGHPPGAAGFERENNDAAPAHAGERTERPGAQRRGCGQRNRSDFSGSKKQA